MFIILENLRWAILTGLMIYGFHRLGKYLGKDKLVFTLRGSEKSRSADRPTFNIVDQDVFLKNLCNRLRITTADFTRPAAITVSPDETEYYNVLDSADHIKMICGESVILNLCPNGSAMISFDPAHRFK